MNMVLSNTASQDERSASVDLGGLSSHVFLLRDLSGFIDLTCAFQVLWEPQDIGREFTFGVRVEDPEGDSHPVMGEGVIPGNSPHMNAIGYFEWRLAQVSFRAASEGVYPMAVVGSDGEPLAATFASVKLLSTN